MLYRCTLISTLMVLLSTSAAARPVVINGNAHGLWSPSHPHLTSGRTKPHSPVLYVPPEPPPIEEPVVSDVCPTLQSAPHLCQSIQLGQVYCPYSPTAETVDLKSIQCWFKSSYGYSSCKSEGCSEVPTHGHNKGLQILLKYDYGFFLRSNLLIANCWRL